MMEDKLVMIPSDITAASNEILLPTKTSRHGYGFLVAIKFEG